MNIAIDVRRIDDFGVGTYIRNLVRALFRKDSTSQYFLVGHASHAEQLGPLPRNFELLEYAHADETFHNHLQLHFLLRSHGIDVLHVPHTRVPLMVPCRYVVTVHDLADFLYDVEDGLWGGVRRQLVRRGLARASRIIAVSRTTRLDVSEFFGIAPQRIDVVHNAIDERFAEPPQYDQIKLVLERYGVNYPFVLYSGSVKPQKNLARLIEAFAVLKGELREHPVYGDLKLIVIGDEISKHPNLRRTVVKCRMEKDVRFLGFVAHDVLRVFYSSAEAFVFPSLYEGFGLPPLEAMALGTPVVVSSVSSLPEVAGSAAVPVNPENIFDIARGTKKVLLDVDLREMMRERGLEQVKKFSWDRCADRVLEIYQETAGSRSAAA